MRFALTVNLPVPLFCGNFPALFKYTYHFDEILKIKRGKKIKKKKKKLKMHIKFQNCIIPIPSIGD